MSKSLDQDFVIVGEYTVNWHHTDNKVDSYTVSEYCHADALQAILDSVYAEAYIKYNKSNLITDTPWEEHIFTVIDVETGEEKQYQVSMETRGDYYMPSIVEVD